MTSRALRDKILEFFPRVLLFDYYRAKANQFGVLEKLSEDPCPATFANLFGTSRMYLIPTIVAETQVCIFLISYEVKNN